MNEHYETIDKSKRRKPNKTPWAIYNPSWIKTRQKLKPAPSTIVRSRHDTAEGPEARGL